VVLDGEGQVRPQVEGQGYAALEGGLARFSRERQRGSEGRGKGGAGRLD